jgi:hypothetical protein
MATSQGLLQPPTCLMMRTCPGNARVVHHSNAVGCFGAPLLCVHS